MPEPIENLYFNWLCAKVVSKENQTPSTSYWTLLKALHNTEFVWIVSRDDNRAEDGLELRYEFLTQMNMENIPEWRRNPGCSVLEMLIAFSKRAEFQMAEPAKQWFWEMLDNLGLSEFNDASEESLYKIEFILDRFIWRTYDPSGVGGLFPLKDPKEDERKVEIWYQFFHYLTDQDRM